MGRPIDEPTPDPVPTEEPDGTPVENPSGEAWPIPVLERASRRH